MESKRLLSLFSGCGGLDIGFEGGFQVLNKSINYKIHDTWIERTKNKFVTLKSTSFDTVFANDILLEAKLAWVNYFSQTKKNANSIYHLDSVVDLVKWHHDNNIVFPKNIDIVTGGFPCQDFSIAGKRQGFESRKSHKGVLLEGVDNPTSENRGKLYMWMREVIKITDPKMFVAENVKGLTTLQDVKGIIENDFRNIGGGYIVVPARVLNAAEYGVPQGRERIIFLGFNKKYLKEKAKRELSKSEIHETYDPYPQKTHTLKPKEEKENSELNDFVSLRSAFAGLKEPDRSRDVSQRWFSKAKFYGKHCQGQTEVDLAGIGPTIRAEHHGNIEFRRLSLEHGGRYEKELNQGKIERRLTVRECARIQTFPDNYDFIFNNDIGRVTSSKAYKIIGNAVPPLLGYHIARSLESKWNQYFK